MLSSPGLNVQMPMTLGTTTRIAPPEPDLAGSPTSNAHARYNLKSNHFLSAGKKKTRDNVCVA